MFPLAGLVTGALLGALAARRRGGNRLDMLQWGAVWSLLLGLLGLFVAVVVIRSAAS